MHWHQAIQESRDQDGVEIGFPGLLPRFVCPLLPAWAKSVSQGEKSVEGAQGIGEPGADLLVAVSLSYPPGDLVS